MTTAPTGSKAAQLVARSGRLGKQPDRIAVGIRNSAGCGGRNHARCGAGRGTTALFGQPILFGEHVQRGSDARGGAYLAWEERKVTPSGTAANVDVRVQHVILGSPASRITTLPSPGAPALAFAVHEIFPNPALARCRISFDLPSPTRVTIDVFDVSGRRVARLADARFEAGAQSLGWELDDRRGRRVPPGLYLVRVVAGAHRAVARATVTR